MKFVMIFAIAFVIAILVTPLSIKIAPAIGGVDIPKDDRRMHTKPIPRVGGIAIYAGVMAAILISMPVTHKMIGILIGGTIIFVLALLDDLRNMPPIVKLVGQIAGAAFVYGFGTRINILNFFGLFDKLNIGAVFSMGLTILWLVAITNAVNLIDGMDGLAAGVIAIASCCIAYVAYIHGTYFQCLPMLAIAGSALGFLPWNFNPAKTFMGDCGSQFLGFMVASISIVGLVKSATLVALVVPLLVLGLPVFDTLYAILRRTIRGQSIMEADKEHIHHSFMKTGMGQRRSVVSMYCIAATMGTAAVLLSRSLYVETIGLCFIALMNIYMIITDRNHMVPKVIEELKEHREEKKK